VNKKTYRFYRSIEKMWNAARDSMEDLDCFSPIQTVESNMRRQFLNFLWTSLKRYGNQEFKRVYSWLEGSVGPLNALLNYAGARLRDLAMILYPFPPPQAFQIREYRDGSKKILTKDEVNDAANDAATRTYWRYGYIEKGMDTPIFLSHPTLPGMDFVDMIRAHCIELCRQCFIYHVPMIEAHRYIRLLIHQLRPFLDWVYTGGEEGRRAFNPDADYELRKIVLEIRSLYRKRSRTRQRISQRHEEVTSSISLESIRRKAVIQLGKSTDAREREFLLRLLNYLDTALITDKGESKDRVEEIRRDILDQMKESSDKVRQAALQKMYDLTTTHSLDFEDEKTPFEQIRERIMTCVTRATDPIERTQFLELIDSFDLKAGYVVYRDIERLVDQIHSLSQRQGNEWHRILFSDLHHPVSLRQVVFSGDKLLNSLSPILVVAELPVAKHSGKIDLTIFVRRDVEGQTLWTPVMILEVKTKTAFDINLYGFQLKRKREPAVTPVFYAWKRALDDEEWESVISSGPDDLALNQLKFYEDELVAEYRQVATNDPNPPASLWKGVIVLDADQSPLEIYPAYQYLIEDLMTGFIHQLVENKDTLSIAPEPLDTGDNPPKVSLLITQSQGPADLLKELKAPRSLPFEDPFREREQDDRILTLYVSVPSPTSSGVTAARLSRNWHLLHHIKECIDSSSRPTNVVWLDLMGDYKTDELLEKRFGLENLHREGRISQEMYRDLTNTLWSTRFLDLSHNINEVLREGNDAFDRLCFNISAFLPEMEEGEYIVVLDGWEDFGGMVPGHQQYLVRALEQKLLDTLPQSNINIIWIDSGTHHTRMNIHYQRKCVTPLRHDSPRRTHLDEIIYNLPAPPRQFWWMNPREEDVRIIVQDTPTRATPWKVAIQVPQLIGFTETFRGLARRDGIVAPEDVVRDNIKLQSMHGRGVTLSSIALSSEHLSTDSSADLLDHALTLVPSVLRQRKTVPDDEIEETIPEREPEWQSAIQSTSSVGTSTLSDRINIDVTRPPPRPRGTDRYVDTLSTAKDNGITRPWRYDQTPQQIPDDDTESHPTTYTPSGEDFEIAEIDTTKTREQELRRLYYATKYLKDQRYVSQKLRECCKKIERYSAKQFCLLRENPNLKTSKFFLGALLRVKRIILEDPRRTEVWNALLPLREKLPDLLDTRNREILEYKTDDDLNLFTLYGNNLFLAILAALGESEVSLAEHLWASVAEWTFYQLGMKIHDEVKSVYSFQAILSNLRSRVKFLSELDLPESITGQEQVGAIYWMEEEETFHALLLVPKGDGFQVGFIKNLGYKRLRGTWFMCESAPSELEKLAHAIDSTSERRPLILREVEGTPVLWVPWKDDIDGELYWDTFSYVHGRPGGRQNVLPWVKLEATIPLAVPGMIPTVPDSVDAFLYRSGLIKHKTIPVKLSVSVDSKTQSYRVDLEGDSLEDTFEFFQTRQLIQFLRSPIRQGSGYRLKGVSLTWDHQRDIDYDSTLSFLKPLVHRSRFFPSEFYVPKTCSELLAATKGDDVIMMIRPEGRLFRIEFEGLPHQSPIKGLEEIGLDLHSMGLLSECKEVYDPVRRTIHSITLNVNAIMDFASSNLHQYPILETALQEADPAEFDWSTDTWKVSARLVGNEVTWSILSTTTNRVWLRKTFTYVFIDGQPPEIAIKEYRTAIEEVVPLSHLVNLNDVLESLESTLRERYQEQQESSDNAGHEVGHDEDVNECDLEEEETLVEVSKVYEDVTFRYTGIGVYRDDVVVSLESEDGDSEDVQVVGNVNKYLEMSRLTGGIEPDEVKTEVTDNLAPYDLEDGAIEEILNAVCKVLESEGVNFYE